MLTGLFLFFLDKGAESTENKARVRFENSRIWTGISSLLGIFCSICLLFLTGCSGTGSSSQGGGAVYDNPSADSTSPVLEALNNANVGNVSKLVELFESGIGGTGAGSTSPMDLPADALWLSEDGTVKLTMTVNGVSKVYTATAQNGNFHFDIPAVVTGSTVSVRMDVLDGNGDLQLTGRTSKIVSGETDSLSLTLSSNFRITVTPPAGLAAWVWMFKEPSDPTWYSISGDYPDYTFSLDSEGEIVQIGGLAVKDNKIYEMPVQSVTLGDEDKVVLTMNTAKNFPDCGSLKKTNSGVAGAPNDRITYEIDSSKKPALLDLDNPGALEVSPAESSPEAKDAFQMRSGPGIEWADSNVWPAGGDSWTAQMYADISTGVEMRMRYEIKVSSTVVGSGYVTNLAN